MSNGDPCFVEIPRLRLRLACERRCHARDCTEHINSILLASTHTALSCHCNSLDPRPLSRWPSTACSHPSCRPRFPTAPPNSYSRTLPRCTLRTARRSPEQSTLRSSSHSFTEFVMPSTNRKLLRPAQPKLVVEVRSLGELRAKQQAERRLS